MKGFKEYVKDNEKLYKFTIKLAVNDITDCILDCLEATLRPYELVSASKFKKTPIQESPLDFPNVKNSPVFISEVVMLYPSTTDFMQLLIANGTGISKQSIAVYSNNDPRQVETDLFNIRSSKEYHENYTPALGTDYPEVDNQWASLQNQTMDLLKELQEVRDNRDVIVADTPLSQQASPDHDTTLPKDYLKFDEYRNIDSPSLFGRTTRSDIKR